MFTMWVYVIVAAAIALGAFAIGQFAPGIGVPFTALASTLWIASCRSRGKPADGEW